MNFNKQRNISNRPLDYLKERKIPSYIPSKASFGTSQIGWESTRLGEKSVIKGSHKATILHLDAWKKNHFTDFSGKFSKSLDKELNMERGFPFNKLDQRRQKKLIKNVDRIQTRIKSRMSSIRAITPRRSEASSKSKRARSQTKFDHAQKNPQNQQRFTKRMRKTTQDLYNKIYEDKLKSHFVTPYPKFPYNLDKDTINLSDAQPKNMTRGTTRRKKSQERKNPLMGSSTKSRIQYYKTDKTERFAEIQKEIIARTLDNRKKNKGFSLFNDYSKSFSKRALKANSNEEKGESGFGSRLSSGQKKRTSCKRSTSRTSNAEKYDKQMERVYRNEERI
ncbi:unnamed protein product [Moneuplotes crassus]|uniref:Uncharacterized protein n=1 Tax=Euplotes crassus TaxID=5936 RepID=A0AAD1XLN5_EUPCR|nr:unnamed protein product [Moneuplotes crassus]